jgi:signal transduction histidine kinase/DNA-binding NarL/FixJ family response regulator
MNMRALLVRKLFWAYVFIAGVAALLALISWEMIREADRVVAQVNRTNDILSHVTKIREATFQIESVTRGYIIAGDKAILAERLPVLQERAVATQALKLLFGDNPNQQARMARLAVVTEERRALSERSMFLRETQGFEAAQANSQTAPVRESRVRYLAVLSEIRDEEIAHLKLLNAQYQATTDKSVLVYAVTLLAMVGLLIFVFVLINRQVSIVDQQLALERTNHALEVEKSAAELASKSKDFFLATMSHEIRTPMSGILGMLELLAHSRLDMEQQETLSTARDSGRSLMRIIDDILDHAKIQAGKLTIVNEPLSVAHLLARIRNTYSVVANNKGLVLRHQVDERIAPLLMGDRLRVVQVLGNFVSNAIKFSPQGMVALSADLIKEEDGFQTIRLTVKDSGIGMTPEAQARLFQPFEQAEMETARMYGGTGLGLAISRKLAEMMEGDISIQSTPGLGTSIALTLKLAVHGTAQARAEAQKTEPTASAQAMIGAASAMTMPPAAMPVLPQMPSLKGPWVLAVDDHPTSRMLIERQLNLLGMRVRTAENGVEALALWRAGNFALVITDSNMPEMNGYDLTRAIREEEKGKTRTPVLGWTANAMIITLARCKEAGMDDVLVKPADLGQLRALLSKWLPPASMADLPVQAIDIKQMEEAFGNDKAKFSHLLPSIRKTLREQVAILNTALTGGELGDVKTLAQTMCGSAAVMGAKGLLDVCERIGTLPVDSDASARSLLSREFTAQAQRTLDALEVLG